MTINRKKDDSKLVLELLGRLDTTTATLFEDEINAITDNSVDLVLDFSELEYLSSPGLRVVLMAQKKMTKNGSLTVKNVNETVMEIFEITGFSDILTIA